jgi:hypothetical protein
MKNLQGKLTLCVAVMLSLMVSCKKEKQEASLEYRTPAIVSTPKIAEAPEKLVNSTVYGAQLAGSFVSSSINVFDAYSTYFVPPDFACKSNRPSGLGYNWTDDKQYNFTMEFGVDNSNYSWDVYSESPNISKHIFLEATDAKSGKSGSAKLYYPTALNVSPLDYQWEKDDAGNTKITIIFPDKKNALYMSVATINIDKSGSYKEYSGVSTNDMLIADISWTADGAGSLMLKDKDSQKTISYSWTE